MQNPRLLYRVILKFLSLFAIVVFLYVLVNSLFVGNKEDKTTKEKTNVVKLDLADMGLNQAKKAVWGGQSIIILKILGNGQPAYKVFYNHGDSGSCPLFYSAEGLKDTCSGTLYDQTGKSLIKNSGKHLDSPPYTVNGDSLVIGRFQ